ncbi:hypothetical protein FIV00_03260 [Labrenzia sp. THAF82]|nr:hypothetical protein FIV00_03260 [Labrenzia sp. THAF82]
MLHRLEKNSDPEFTRRLSDWLARELPDFLTREADEDPFADLIGVTSENQNKAS